MIICIKINNSFGMLFLHNSYCKVKPMRTMLQYNSVTTDYSTFIV
jgi:hypothetical protein